MFAAGVSDNASTQAIGALDWERKANDEDMGRR